MAQMVEILAWFLTLMSKVIVVQLSAEADSVYDRLFTDITRGYNYRIRPYFGIKPVDVDVFLYIGSIRSISEQTMDYKLELYFREYWKDPRLYFSPQNYANLSKIPLHESLFSQLWIPDTFLPNAIQSENPDTRSITHRSLMRLQQDGHILYSRRLSVTAECPMDLTLYPFDKQVCRLSIESYGLSVEDIVYHWRKPEPVKLSEQLTLPDYQILDVLARSRNITLATGTYSRLECCFVFVRSAGFYFMQLYIPATTIVTTAWLALWMEEESTFSDMIEVILAITFLYYSYNTVMPKVSYIKAMDIYLGGCFIFVFLALTTLAVLKHLRMYLKRYELQASSSMYAGDSERQSLLLYQTAETRYSGSNRASNRRPLHRGSTVLPLTEPESTTGTTGPAGTTVKAVTSQRGIRRLATSNSTENNSPTTELKLFEFINAAADYGENGELNFPPIPPPPVRRRSQLKLTLPTKPSSLRHCRALILFLYPAAFLAFTGIYFIAYVGVADQDTMKNCRFD